MKKILIVEDDQIVANIYRNKFSVEGFQVEVALDGQLGLETLRSFQPDAIILDLMLPKMTGVELTKQIRAEPGCDKLPIIVFSNTYLTNLVQEAWKAGATKCLSKANCSPKMVIEVVRSALNGNTSPTAPSVAPTQPRHSAHSVSPVPKAAANGPAVAPATTEANTDADAEFQADLRKSFIKGLPALLGALRNQLQGLIKSENEARLNQIQEMYRRIHALTGNAGLAGLALIAQMADALEALLKELHEKPKNINAST